MHLKNLIPVILCGGIGSRMWPVSQPKHPKPFIKLPDGSTLFKKSVLLANLLSDKYIIIISNYEFENHIKKELKEIDLNNDKRIIIIYEPYSRNTGPAITLASIYIKNVLKLDNLIITLTADHIINPIEYIKILVEKIDNVDLTKYGVLFGIKPTCPSSKYGYIKIKNTNNSFIYEVERFIEKPNINKAKKLLVQNNYFWNSGIFLFDNNFLFDSLIKHCKNIVDCVLTSIPNNLNNKKEIYVYDTFKLCPNISIDYALIEKLKNIKMIKANFNWQDIGSFDNYFNLFKTDKYNNKVASKNLKVTNCFKINSEINNNNLNVYAIGLENITIIEKDNNILICHNDLLDKASELIIEHDSKKIE